jgi:hypothetical protein
MLAAAFLDGMTGVIIQRTESSQKKESSPPKTEKLNYFANCFAPERQIGCNSDCLENILAKI